MTGPISKEDQQWLDALAGQEVPNSQLNSQAQVLRSALQQRRLEIETDAGKDRSNELESLRSRLQREGLIRTKAEASKTWIEKCIEWFFPGSHSHGRNTGTSLSLTRAIPVALLMVIATGAVWLAFQSKTPQIDERLIYRGDPNVVSLLVNDPEQRANELAIGLKAIHGIVTVQALKPSGWLLQVQDTNLVREYLAAQRIEAIAVNGQVTLLVLQVENAKH